MFTLLAQEAKRKIDGLLESLLSEYQLYSGLINKTSEARVEGLTATRDRAQQVAAINIGLYVIMHHHYPNAIMFCFFTQPNTNLTDTVSMAAVTLSTCR